MVWSNYNWKKRRTLCLKSGSNWSIKTLSWQVLKMRSRVRNRRTGLQVKRLKGSWARPCETRRSFRIRPQRSRPSTSHRADSNQTWRRNSRKYSKKMHRSSFKASNTFNSRMSWLRSRRTTISVTWNWSRQRMRWRNSTRRKTNLLKLKLSSPRLERISFRSQSKFKMYKDHSLLLKRISLFWKKSWVTLQRTFHRRDKTWSTAVQPLMLLRRSLKAKDRRWSWLGAS